MLSDSLLAARWALKTLTVVNWGGYDGHHQFSPSLSRDGRVTLLTGESESGKSTLLDAHTSLLYPTGSAYNKASNQGRSERSDFTYLRGQVGVREQYGKSTPEYLRGKNVDGTPCPVWGAIAELYESSLGGVVTIAKFMYLAAGDGSDRVRKYFVVAEGTLDVREMDAYRNEAFTPGLLKRTYAGARVFGSAESFHESAWGLFGLTKDACRLLHRMQASDAPSKLDDIFKQGVLDEPRALAYARNAVDDYRRYQANFTEMQRNNERKALLEDVVAHYERYERADAELRGLLPIDPQTERGAQNVTRRLLVLMRADVMAGLPLLVAERDALESRSNDVEGRRRVAQEHLDEVKGKLGGTAGGNLAVLENNLVNARETLTRVRSDRARLAASFSAARRTVPHDEASFLEDAKWAAQLAQGYAEKKKALSDQRLKAALAERDAEGRCAAALGDYERASKQRTRITEDMAQDRARLARATGLPEGELPFVAELVDTDDESWRMAMNVTYGSLARVILVDKRHEQGFAARVSAVDPTRMRRRNWEFVDTSVGYDDLTRPGWMSSHVEYRADTPFEGWLRSRLSSERNDARCVEAIDDGEHGFRQVQRDGQLKDAKRGAHGTKGVREVIGFVTQDYLDHLHEIVVSENERWTDARDEHKRMEQALSGLDAERQLASALEGLSWSRVDVDGAAATCDEMAATIEAIKSDPRVGELVAQREKLEREVGRLSDKLYDAKRKVAEAGVVIENAHEWLGSAQVREAEADAEAGASLPQACVQCLSEAYEALWTDDEGAVERLRALSEPPRAMARKAPRATSGAGAFPRVERMLDRVTRGVTDTFERLRDDADAKQQLCEGKMSHYLGMYAADDENIGTHVDDIGWYRDELEQVHLVAPGKSTRKEYENALDVMLKTFMQAKISDADDCKHIREQTKSINALLATFPFGAKRGTLSLDADIRRPTPEYRNTLRRIIDRLNDYQERDDSQRTAKAALRVFKACEPLIALMERDLDLLRQNRAYELDARNRTHFTTRVDNGEGEVEVVGSTTSGSGGYVQELVSFVYGAALIYLLGDANSGTPSYATVFMDEALIKADAQYTQRVLGVLPGLGFQVIVAAPLSKTSEMMSCADVMYVAYRNRDTNTSSLHRAWLESSEEPDVREEVS